MEFFVDLFVLRMRWSPDRCDSIGWASNCKLKGHQCDSLSGHMPRLQAQSLVGACARGNRLSFSLTSIFLSISSSLPSFFFKNKKIALAGVAQWIECWPVKQRVPGLIPSQGTCLGCRPGPQWGAHERQPHMDVSLPLFLPPSPSL